MLNLRKPFGTDHHHVLFIYQTSSPNTLQRSWISSFLLKYMKYPEATEWAQAAFSMALCSELSPLADPRAAARYPSWLLPSPPALCSMPSSCWLVHKDTARCLLPASLATCWLPFTSLPLPCSPAGISALLSWCLCSPAECQVVSFHPSHLSYISLLNAWLCFFFFLFFFLIANSISISLCLYICIHWDINVKNTNTYSHIFSALLPAYSLPMIAWIYVKQQVPFKIPAAHWHYQWCQFVSASTVIVAEKASFAVRFSKAHDFFYTKALEAMLWVIAVL